MHRFEQHAELALQVAPAGAHVGVQAGVEAQLVSLQSIARSQSLSMPSVQISDGTGQSAEHVHGVSSPLHAWSPHVGGGPQSRLHVLPFSRPVHELSPQQ